MYRRGSVPKRVCPQTVRSANLKIDLRREPLPEPQASLSKNKRQDLSSGYVLKRRCRVFSTGEGEKPQEDKDVLATPLSAGFKKPLCSHNPFGFMRLPTKSTVPNIKSRLPFRRAVRQRISRPSARPAQQRVFLHHSEATCGFGCCCHNFFRINTVVMSALPVLRLLSALVWPDICFFFGN